MDLALFEEEKETKTPSTLPWACLLNRFGCVQLTENLLSVACQAPLSMGFSQHEYWGRLPCSPPGDLPDPGIEPTSSVSPALQTVSFLLIHWGSPKGAIMRIQTCLVTGILSFPGSRIERNKCLLFKPSNLWHSVIAVHAPLGVSVRIKCYKVIRWRNLTNIMFGEYRVI